MTTADAWFVAFLTVAFLNTLESLHRTTSFSAFHLGPKRSTPENALRKNQIQQCQIFNPNCNFHLLKLLHHCCRSYDIFVNGGNFLWLQIQDTLIEQLVKFYCMENSVRVL